LLAKTIYQREGLYSDFITESARLFLDALEHDEGDPKNLIPAYALLSPIRLSSPADLLASAEEVIMEIIATYSKPNLTLEQIRSRATAREHNSLRRFSDICRVELESMQRQMRLKRKRGGRLCAKHNARSTPTTELVEKSICIPEPLNRV
jgi:hypothetical protein